MRKIIISLCLLFSLLIFTNDPPEVRGVYIPIWDIDTQAKCDDVISKILNSNLNAVFLHVRARGDAYYYPNREDSTYPNPEPRAQLYSLDPSDLDVLQYFIDRMHNANPPRRVIAWCVTYPTWNRSYAPSSPNHVYNAHPDWITEKKDGTTYTYSDDAPLDPGIPAVQDYLYNVYMDIVRNYDIDGIHFDYIRLLGADSGYDPVAKSAFKSQTGWDIDSDNPNGELDEVYEAWRRDQITKLVERIYNRVKLEKPWVEVSAFTVNFTDSIENLGQGYNWWVAHKKIDLLCPSCYASDVQGCVDDWNFVVNKLAMNNDEYTRKVASAIGDYLLNDPNENSDAVNTLRNNSRKPDGFVFFDYGSLFLDGPDTNPDEHADNLFNSGGPMDDWAPYIEYGYSSDEEYIPPEPPANLTVDTSTTGYAVITFNRPAPASDGDLPVHYRLYRDTQTPVRLYYKNMIMEWWDLDSQRTSFTYTDKFFENGTYYYAAVSYDDRNNAAISYSGAVNVEGFYIIEARSGGKHNSDYSEISGAFADSSAHSSADGCTSGIGSRYSYASNGADVARFIPSALNTGLYDVYVTTYDYSSANAPHITVRIKDADGIKTLYFDLTYTNCGNKWTKIDSMNFTANSGHYIEFDNSTQNGGDRMVMDAVLFVPAGTSLLPSQQKEPKPPVEEQESSVTEVIVDSTPQSLDYDDDGSYWADTSYDGYYNGSARYYGSSNTFPMKAYAIWIVDLPRSGYWAIDGWDRYNTSHATAAKYRFVDGNGVVHDVVASQRWTYNDTSHGDWIIDIDGVSDENAFYFKKGHVYVTLYGTANPPETIIADAIRFRFIDSTPVKDWQLYIR